ncbi:MAG: His/Gly/Thr/Pro-type tRNA ligase C-terminal domain-containing protein [Erysipelotrichaceae bacterium]|nr:His/Gly/Thr/Pro-type tRNA ligase C-terminal domain-containing protein [Erysipelotrichaceae bacterium]
MKVSRMGLKNVKLTELDKMYPGQDILLQTGQIKQFGSGLYAYDNIVLRVEDNIEKIIKKHMDKIDAIEVEMPLLQQEELWRSSGRFDKYIKEGVMLTVKTDKGNYCLAPTAEEAITKFAENRIVSYKQLPVSFYQIGKKFRDEIRNRGYLYRGKEFLMFDLYSFDQDEEGLNKTYDKVKKAYFDAFEELNLDLVAVAADNGTIGGTRSEEMMVISESGEDTILYDGKVGLNTEVLEKENYQEYLKKEYNITDIANLNRLKAIELGHIFALGTKYSESMNVKYIDQNNQVKPFYMGCYGIGVSRVLGVIYENNTIKQNGEVVGFSLPLSVAPYYLYIISNNDRTNEALELYETLENLNIPVIIDDTNDSIGKKIRNAKVLGIPYIAILGNSTEVGNIELEYTKDDTKEIVSKSELITKFEKISK